MRGGLGYSRGFNPTRPLCLGIPLLGASSLLVLYFELKKHRRVSSAISWNLGKVAAAIATVHILLKCLTTIVGNTIKDRYDLISIIEDRSFATSLTPRLTDTGICILCVWLVIFIKRERSPSPQPDSLQIFGIMVGVAWVLLSIVKDVTTINPF